jgi:apurinic endonuclease APN1
MTDIELVENIWNIGSHVSFEGNVTRSIKHAINNGMYSLQIFLGSPQTYDRACISENDIKDSANLLSKFPTNLFIHTPFLFNLCGSVKQLAWEGNSKQDSITSKVVNSIQYELEILDRIHKRIIPKSKDKVRMGVVVHPGNYPDVKKGLEKIAETINMINFPKNLNVKLLLENSSGGGNKLATTFEQIGTIIKNIHPYKRKYIGVCVDTAHIYGFGSYDLRKIDRVKQLFSEFDEYIGLEYFSLLHLNDSSKSSTDKRKDAFLGSKKDVHELIGYGYIWENNVEPLIYLLNRCKELNNTPIILETSPSDVQTLHTLSCCCEN